MGYRMDTALGLFYSGCIPATCLTSLRPTYQSYTATRAILNYTCRFAPMHLLAQEALVAISACIAELRAWMTADELVFNHGETENLLVCARRQQLLKVVIDAFTVGSCLVSAPASSVRNLDVWFKSELTMNTHVNKLCSAAYFHLCNVKRIRKYLAQETCMKPVSH